MTNNENLAREFEYLLKDVMELNSPIEADEDDVIMFDGLSYIRTFEEAGILTNDKGLVVKLEDGAEIHITIQAYKQSERRTHMNNTEPNNDLERETKSFGIRYKDDCYEYVSENGIVYDLYEGVSIGKPYAEKHYTSDLIFIVLMKYEDIVERARNVGYVFGAGLIEQDNFRKDLEDCIKYQVDEFENENSELINLIRKEK